MVRFVNNTTDQVTLAADGVALFTDIAPGTVTGYVALADSPATFALVMRDVGDPAIITHTLDTDASYTITARKGLEGNARLTVTREEQPGTTPKPW